MFSQRKLTVLSKLVKEAGPLQDEALKFGSDLKQFSRSKDNGLKFWMGRYYKPLFEEIESIRTKFESRRREKQNRKKRNGGRASSGPGLQPTENFESPYSERLRKLQSDLMKVDCYEDGSTNPAVLLRTIILRRITEMTDISHLIRVALSACSTNPDISTKQQLRMVKLSRCPRPSVLISFFSDPIFPVFLCAHNLTLANAHQSMHRPQKLKKKTARIISKYPTHVAQRPRFQFACFVCPEFAAKLTSGAGWCFPESFNGFN